MAAGMLLLAAGTAKTEIVNLPVSGNWCGLTRAGITTQVANATIHEWVFIQPNAPGGKTWYRRTNVSSANNWYNGTLVPHVEQSRWLFQSECLMRITYTSTNPIAVVFETTRGILSSITDQVGLAQWNIASATPWTGGGNNLTGPNATERNVGSLNGVIYWKPTG